KNGIWEMYYAHMSKILAKAGQKVTRGTNLGLVGSTGTSTAAHLHYEVRKNGKPLDPMKVSPMGGAGAGVQRWAGVATRALKMTGSYSANNLQRLLYQMKTESNGNPRAINNWDINAKRGTPSKGLMQVIDPTFRAYKMPGYNNIWNPLDNILASIRYAKSRYGSLSKAYRGVGYADGGIVDTKQLAWIAEGGWAESIISHDPAKYNSQKAIWQKTGDALGFTDDKYSKQVLKELERIAQIIENGDGNIVNAIENKPILSENDIKRSYDKRDSRES